MAALTRRTPDPKAPDSETSPTVLATGMAASAATQFGNMSEAEIDAAIALAVTGIKTAETLKTSGTKAATEAVKNASCNLLMLVGRKYQVNPNAKGEDIALMVEGKDVIAKWQAPTKAARYSEWDAIGEAARKVPARFTPDLFATAGGKDKFITLCRAIVKEPALGADALKTLADTKPEQTDGDLIEGALRLIGKVTAKNYPLVHDAAVFLKELRDEKDANGLHTGAEMRRAAAKGVAVTTDGAQRELTAREKIALYQQQQAAKPTVQ